MEQLICPGYAIRSSNITRVFPLVRVILVEGERNLYDYSDSCFHSIIMSLNLSLAYCISRYSVPARTPQRRSPLSLSLATLGEAGIG